MKKAVFVLLGAVITVMVLTAQFNVGGDRDSNLKELYKFTTHSGFGKNVLEFQRSRSNIWIGLNLQTRNADDSLTVTAQATNNLTDTAWVTITNFGGTKTAAGRTNRAYVWGTNTQGIQDSTKYVGKYMRFMVNHGGSADSSEATDTSTFSLEFLQFGDQFWPR